MSHRARIRMSHPVGSGVMFSCSLHVLYPSSDSLALVSCLGIGGAGIPMRRETPFVPLQSNTSLWPPVPQVSSSRGLALTRTLYLSCSSTPP